jgi:hypothetical protein
VRASSLNVLANVLPHARYSISSNLLELRILPERRVTTGLRNIAIAGVHFTAQREPHWNVTVLVPSELVTMLDVIGCEPDFRQ